MTDEDLTLARDALNMQNVMTAALGKAYPEGAEPVAAYHAQCSMLAQLCYHLIDAGVFKDEADMKEQLNCTLQASLTAMRHQRDAEGKPVS